MHSSHSFFLYLPFLASLNETAIGAIISTFNTWREKAARHFITTPMIGHAFATLAFAVTDFISARTGKCQFFLVTLLHDFTSFRAIHQHLL